MTYPDSRPRRLRRTAAMRRLVEETRPAPGELVLPMFVKEGLLEPRPVPSLPGVVQHSRESLRKAAADAVHAGVGGIMLFGVPQERDEVGSGGTDPDGVLNVAIRDVIAEVGDALCRDERPVPGRVHVARALRRAGPGRQRGQRRDAGALRRDGGGAGGVGGSPGRAVGDDGRPGRRGAPCARRGGLRGRGDPGVRGEVRIGVLRPVPGRGGVVAGGGSQDVPAGSPERARGAARSGAGRGRGRGHRDGEAGVAVPGRGVGRAIHSGCSRGGLSGERRVRDGGGGGGERLAGPRSGDAGDADGDPSGRCAGHPHLLGGARRPACCASATDVASLATPVSRSRSVTGPAPDPGRSPTTFALLRRRQHPT